MRLSVYGRVIAWFVLQRKRFSLNRMPDFFGFGLLIGKIADQKDNQNCQYKAYGAGTPAKVSCHPVGEGSAKRSGHNIGEPEGEDAVPMEITVTKCRYENEKREAKAGGEGSPAQAVCGKVSCGCTQCKGAQYYLRVCSVAQTLRLQGPFRKSRKMCYDEEDKMGCEIIESRGSCLWTLIC